MDAPVAVLTTSGRAAIALAIRELGIGAGHEVIIPAYHCLALSAPIQAAGAEVISYNMTPQLGFDVEEVRRRMTPRTRCIVVAHFFGFPESTEGVRALCDSTGVALLEDCAHLFHSSGGPDIPGRHGDFVVGSLMKFFPVYDGGCVTSYRRGFREEPVLRANGLIYQLKALLCVVERSAQWSGSRSLRSLTRTVGLFTSWFKRSNPAMARAIADGSPAATQGSVEFEEMWVNTKPSLVSRLIFRFADYERSIHLRRTHYETYARELGSLAGGRPFRADLPAGVVPYVFPFLLADPGMFLELRAAGVPMYRWEDVDDSTCAVSREYRYRLVQFPCHQALDASQVMDLIGTIRGVIQPGSGK
jgi:dTDP-4-amino-4,6-dideoxygalactose transaminase